MAAETPHGVVTADGCAGACLDDGAFRARVERAERGGAARAAMQAANAESLLREALAAIDAAHAMLLDGRRAPSTRMHLAVAILADARGRVPR